MRAAAASSRKAVVVAEDENDGLASKADSAQFQSDELEVRHPLIPSLHFLLLHNSPEKSVHCLGCICMLVFEKETHD
jgi:hypothetical protein